MSDSFKLLELMTAIACHMLANTIKKSSETFSKLLYIKSKNLEPKFSKFWEGSTSYQLSEFFLNPKE